jgi:hypothetical protein
MEMQQYIWAGNINWQSRLFPIPQALRYGLNLLCIARHGSRRVAHRKRGVHWFNTVMFLPLTLRQRTPET